MKPDPHNKIESVAAIVFVVIFLVLLFGPIIQMNIPLFAERAPSDNRVLAKKPILSHPVNLQAFVDLKNGYEKYFSDHFGFRNTFIKINSMVAVNLLKTSTSEDVVIGKDGWLFYDRATDGANIDDYEGNMPLSEEKLSLIRKNLSLLKKEVRARGAVLVITIPPNKHTVYPEHLPKGIIKGSITRADQVKAVISELGIPLVDPAESLIREKSNKKVYYKTDTHWTAQGGFVGYQELVTGIKKSFPSLPTYTHRDFVATETQWEGGDLARFLDSTRANLENFEHITFNQADAISGADMVLDINNPTREPYQVTNASSKNRLRALVYHDSFFKEMEQFFDHSFNKVSYVWGLVPLFKYMDEVRPHVVVYEFVERYAGNISDIDWETWQSTQQTKHFK